MKDSNRIQIVVVESHQHVLEHVHFVLRRKRRLLLDSSSTACWSMLHFDAHPDLACPHPTVPAAACFQPRRTWDVVGKDGKAPEEKDLYELLDSTSTGIAEWILPLVLAANLTRVQWVRPSGQSLKQLPLGKHQYHVGTWVPVPNDVEMVSPPASFLDLSQTAIVKVDWNCPYYQDDDTSVPFETLHFPKLLNLEVSELSDYSQSEEQHSGQQDADLLPWTLDICLDYFCCLNPFVTDLEQLDSAFCNAFLDCVLQSTLYNSDGANHAPRSQHALATFRQLLLQVLHSTATSPDEKDAPIKSALVEYYEPPELGKRLVNDLIASLDASAENRVRLTSLAVEALPNLTMPHDTTKTTMGAIRPSLLAVREAIVREQQQTKTDPFIITIARSSVDGFTPAGVVEELQNELLKMIHDVHCTCPHAPLKPNDCTDGCRLNLIFDYGEWEGSTLDNVQ